MKKHEEGRSGSIFRPDWLTHEKVKKKTILLRR